MHTWGFIQTLLLSEPGRLIPFEYKVLLSFIYSPPPFFLGGWGVGGGVGGERAVGGGIVFH